MRERGREMEGGGREGEAQGGGQGRQARERGRGSWDRACCVSQKRRISLSCARKRGKKEKKEEICATSSHSLSSIVPIISISLEPRTALSVPHTKVHRRNVARMRI
jgi:hypothetical protein